MELDVVKKELIAAGLKIDDCIKHRLFTTQDIKDFLNKDVYEVFALNARDLKEFKTRMLYNIYLKPFELYYSRYFERELLDTAIPLIQDRYVQEKTYIDDKFKEGELHKLEYQDMMDKLDMYYVYSSNYGFNILRKYKR